MPLSSKHHRLVRLRRLLRRRTLREAERKFVIEGPRSIDSALSGGVELEALYYEESSNELVERVLAGAALTGYRIYYVTGGTLDRVADAVTSQSIFAVASFVDVDLSALNLESLVVVMAGVRDPGNAGTIIRSALAAGASAVIMCEQCVDLYNPKTVRSSAGALFSIPIAVVGSLSEVVEHLRKFGYRIFATSSYAETSYWKCELSGKSAILLGNEGEGLTSAQESLADITIKVPIDDRAESLNVGVAASVIMFEANRQRGLQT